MFFAKSLIVVAALAAHVLGHATVAPVMGVKGKAVRADTQRPSTAKPCGKTALSEIDSSDFITMTGNTITATATNFNKAKDGSMQFTASMDPTGTGKNFKAITITKNGPAAPKNVGETATLTMSVPAGMKCTGGATKDKCLMSFKSESGFGNCVVVKQAGAGNGAAAANKPAPKSKAASRSRSVPHPRNFIVPSQKRDYAKRALEWIWRPTA
ncbi:hypothetical protein FRC12_016302 [Ceratobasidium sp. 428]|nr:hypothetical protein FRC12_016302 [Ceratobasidium sp. 428]